MSTNEQLISTESEYPRHSHRSSSSSFASRQVLRSIALKLKCFVLLRMYVCCCVVLIELNRFEHLFIAMYKNDDSRSRLESNRIECYICGSQDENSNGIAEGRKERWRNGKEGTNQR